MSTKTIKIVMEKSTQKSVKINKNYIKKSGKNKSVAIFKNKSKITLKNKPKSC